MSLWWVLEGSLEGDNQGGQMEGHQEYMGVTGSYPGQGAPTKEVNKEVNKEVVNQSQSTIQEISRSPLWTRTLQGSDSWGTTTKIEIHCQPQKKKAGHSTTTPSGSMEEPGKTN
jgi:hypothetical protein